jgi:hypothetical protein
LGKTKFGQSRAVSYCTSKKHIRVLARPPVTFEIKQGLDLWRLIVEVERSGLKIIDDDWRPCYAYSRARRVFVTLGTEVCEEE